MRHTAQNSIAEWSLTSGRAYEDPCSQVEVGIVAMDPDGEEHSVPAFWSGEQTWGVCYASAKIGEHRWRSVCSDTGNAGLHGREGVLEVGPYTGDNPLLQHGPLQVSDSKRYLQHRDGTPLFLAGGYLVDGSVRAPPVAG